MAERGSVRQRHMRPIGSRDILCPVQELLSWYLAKRKVLCCRILTGLGKFSTGLSICQKWQNAVGRREHIKEARLIALLVGHGQVEVV